MTIDPFFQGSSVTARPLDQPIASTIQPTSLSTASSAHQLSAPNAGAINGAQVGSNLSASRPNPRIEFDQKLGLVVLEYHDSSGHVVTRYPDSAKPAQVATHKRDLTA